MYPTLNAERRDTDRVVVRRWGYDGTNVVRGDIVAVQSPEATPSVLIKRVVGLPGDVIKLRHGEGMHYVPEGHCWLQGDNKATSRDSDAFGPVPLALVLGKATKRFSGLGFWNAEELSHEVNVNCFVFSSDAAIQTNVDKEMAPLPAASDDELAAALAVLETQMEEDGRHVADIIS